MVRIEQENNPCPNLVVFPKYYGYAKSPEHQIQATQEVWGLSSFGNRHCEMKSRALVQLALEPNSPTLHFNQAFRNIQAQPGA